MACQFHPAALEDFEAINVIINHSCKALKAVLLVSSDAVAAQFRVCQAVTASIHWKLISQIGKDKHKVEYSSTVRVHNNRLNV